MAGLNVEDILAECGNSDLWEETQDDHGHDDGFIGISEHILEEALHDLLSDQCLSDDIKDELRGIDIKLLLPTLLFLDKCLVRKGKFKSSAKEKSFKNFHQTFLLYMDKIIAVTSPSSATWITMKVFNILIRENYDGVPLAEAKSEQSVLVSEFDAEVAEYIGGYVIHSLKKQARRLSNKEEKANRLQCLEHLCLGMDHSDTCPGTSASLTNMLDRGGLTKLKPSIAEVFVGLEVIFRELFNEELQSLKYEEYYLKCCQSDSVGTALYDQMYSVCVPEETKERILHGIAKLYFTVRVHHKCKTYMDKHRLTTRTSKKQKGLRKNILQKANKDC